MVVLPQRNGRYTAREQQKQTPNIAITAGCHDGAQSAAFSSQSSYTRESPSKRAFATQQKYLDCSILFRTMTTFQKMDALQSLSTSSTSPMKTKK